MKVSNFFKSTLSIIIKIMSKGILNSKGFWIFALIIFIVVTLYLMEKNSNKTWTAEDERNSIQLCQKWVGTISYDGECVGSNGIPI